MTFVSMEFAILFAITALSFQLCKKEKSRQWVLLLASYLFYAYWDIRFLGLLLFQSYISYALAKKIAKTSVERLRKRYCVIGVFVSLLILGVFKYFNFFMENMQALLGNKEWDALYIILPVGISFYTFQALSYLIDVYRNNLDARKDFFTVSLYVSFFPQLVAGPIVRATDFLKQCDQEHFIKKENVESAIQIFLFGLMKKVVIADRLAVCVDAVFRVPQAYDSPTVICAVIAYSIQIYCDFSGYSDMAIGIAKFFDFDLCKNFNVPYISKNPTEFWKRWHISLSSWLKDYLYISLGGNRKGKVRTYLNLLITMILGGLWHGASWNFVIWGTMHGVALIVHKLFQQMKIRYHVSVQGKLIRRFVDFVSIIATYIFVSVCWVFFRSKDMHSAFLIIKKMFIWDGGLHYIYIFTIIYTLFVLAGHVYALCFQKGKGVYPVIKLDTFWNKLLLCLFFWFIIVFSYDGNNAFIYFQF